MDFFNADYKQYLRSDDKSLSDTRINGTVYTIKSFFIAVSISVLIVFMGLIKAAAKESLSRIQGPDVIFIWASVFGLIWLIAAMHYKSYRFIVAKHGIYEISGIIFKKIKFVPYGKICDSVLERGLFDLILGTGTIGISTAGGTKSYQGTSQPYEIRIRSVDDYKKIREMIFKGMK